MLHQEHFKVCDEDKKSEDGLSTVMSGRGFSYSKHGLLSANLIVKEE